MEKCPILVPCRFVGNVYRMRTLYHATTADSADAILRDGLRAGAYLTDREDVAAYYADGIREEGAVAVILEVDLDVLLAAVSPGSLIPDRPSIDEPLTFTLGKSDAEILCSWERSNGTWQECLEIVGSIEVTAPIPPSIIALSDAFVPSPHTVRV